MIIGGIGGALVFVTIFVFIVVCLQIRFKHNGAIGGRSSARCQHFALTDVKAATDEFNDSFVIGNGGFGKVYKGYIDRHLI
ncbi:putative non-specific serine/threonine protein kinase [Helianthus annuus]|uniref:Non-specific serine/threonine protein kinase n=1 Tax=Helianthus annuus TaxID=4232 RepID=A0A9K3E4Z6_HELAN|nr:putative non-specific serine/threonine protein kinase [Helianthus annuus]KAJ0452578.1 putative non-specific serine/threonine protein kinase [Helianthus annuus]KAJ0457522.1 putative non-specific serine/threonine protein kinase [Helianthus annuus]KAJ0474486.1 putative non-specific serine/threonine protein kinase [Helianthus annuus]KAJ0650042.1 putative non-specific serine/threonine protein kinase [Helianthus annuus]